MNARLSLAEFVARLDATLNVVPGSVYVSSAHARDYLTAFGKTVPAVWVIAQRLVPHGEGLGASGLYRQRVRIEVMVRIIVERYADGMTNGEAGLNALHDDVADCLKDWTPTGADRALAWVSSTDGAPFEGVLTADLIFFTHATYTRQP